MRKLSNLSAPFVRTETTSRHMTMDVLLAAVPLCAFSVFNYGVRPLWVVLLTILSALVCEAGCCLILRKPLSTLTDGSAAVTGAIIGLAMSPLVPMWIPMLGAAFAIIVVKAPFGGYGRNVFNPAAAGIAILSYCFPQSMFTYPAIDKSVILPADFYVDPTTVITETSIASQLRAGANPGLTGMQLLTGDFAGPIGGTATLILLACAAFLMFRRTTSTCMTVSYLGTCFIIACLVPYSGVGGTYSAAYQMCAGYVLFTGVFLLNDPVTSPRYLLGRVFYGVIAAILVMLLQRIGRVEAGSCFAILIMNTLSPIIDRWSWHGRRRLLRLFRMRREVASNE